MKKALILLALLVAGRASAQTTVNLTVSDTPDAQTWNNGTWTTTLQATPGTTPPMQPYVVNSGGGSVASQSGSLSSSGTAVISLPANLNILPAQSVWAFSVCPQATSPCFQSFVTVSSTSPQTLLISPPSIRINFRNATPPVVAYTDAEVGGASLGAQYFNEISGVYRVCTISASSCTWVVGGGGNSGNINGNAVIKGPNPWVDVTAFGASGSSANTTGSCSGTSAILASAIDFVNGNGIWLSQCGPVSTLIEPTGSSAAPLYATGSTTYSYDVCAVDANGGCSAHEGIFSTTTGPATLTAVAPIRLTMPTLQTGAIGYQVYGRSGSDGSLTKLGFTTENVYDDCGYSYLDSDQDAPTQPGAASIGDLITTIVSGGGTTSLTLADAASTSQGSTFIEHDDYPNIVSALATIPQGGTLWIPLSANPATNQYQVFPQIVITGSQSFESNGASLRAINDWTPLFQCAGIANACNGMIMSGMTLQGNRDLVFTGGNVSGGEHLTSMTFHGVGGIFVAGSIVGLHTDYDYYDGVGRQFELLADGPTTLLDNWSNDFSEFGTQTGTDSNIFVPCTTCGTSVYSANTTFLEGGGNTNTLPVVIGNQQEVNWQSFQLDDENSANAMITTGWAVTKGSAELTDFTCTVCFLSNAGTGDVFNGPGVNWSFIGGSLSVTGGGGGKVFDGAVNGLTLINVWTIVPLQTFTGTLPVIINTNINNTSPGSSIVSAVASSGTLRKTGLSITDTVTLSGGAATVTFASGFTGANTYTCQFYDTTTPSNSVTPTYTSGTSLGLAGTGTDVIKYSCMGY